MKFNGNSFIYNGIPSELYDLRIITMDTSGKSDDESGIESTLSVDASLQKIKS